LPGGVGTRLWAVLRDATPNQFLPPVGEKSTLPAGDLYKRR